MPRLTAAIVVLLVAVLLAGCGSNSNTNPESKDAERAPDATIVAADTDKTGEFWQGLDADEQFSNGAYTAVSNVAVAGLARAISAHYDRGNDTDRIADVCASKARLQIRKVSLALSGQPGSKSKTSRATKSGQVFPPEATVTVRWSSATGDGWDKPETVKVNPNTGEFTAKLDLKVGGENDFRLDAKHPGMRGSTEVFYVMREKSAAEKAAERAARAQAQADKLAAATLTYSGNGGKTIGTIKIPMDSTLSWTNDGDLFTIFDDDASLFVNSQGASGTTDAPQGTYTGVLVNAIGNWTITITPKG